MRISTNNDKKLRRTLPPAGLSGLFRDFEIMKYAMVYTAGDFDEQEPFGPEFSRLSSRFNFYMWYRAVRFGNGNAKALYKLHYPSLPCPKVGNLLHDASVYLHEFARVEKEDEANDICHHCKARELGANYSIISAHEVDFRSHKKFDQFAGECRGIMPRLSAWSNTGLHLNFNVPKSWLL